MAAHENERPTTSSAFRYSHNRILHLQCQSWLFLGPMTFKSAHASVAGPHVAFSGAHLASVIADAAERPPHVRFADPRSRPQPLSRRTITLSSRASHRTCRSGSLVSPHRCPRCASHLVRSRVNEPPCRSREPRWHSRELRRHFRELRCHSAELRSRSRQLRCRSSQLPWQSPALRYHSVRNSSRNSHLHRRSHYLTRPDRDLTCQRSQLT